jgi:PAT family beta-lactamase induction signal transducer AmpG
MIPDGLSSPRRRRWLFALLYVSEGAPVGYLWTALPTRLRMEGVPVAEVAALASLLTIPWSIKFLWAPLIDGVRSERYGLRPWILGAQFAMGLTLVPLLAPGFDVGWLFPILVVHAFCAATQDVAIDALAVKSLGVDERGRATGWMQMGMVLGKAAFGGAAVAVESRVGTPPVIAALIATTWLSGVFVAGAHDTALRARARSHVDTLRDVAVRLREVFSRRVTWLGMGLAASAGMAMEALGGLAGPMLVDQGISSDRIGGFFVVVPIVGLGGGALLGGWLADRMPRRRAVAASSIAVALSCGFVGVVLGHGQQWSLLAALAVAWGAFGALTACLYAQLMDLVDPALGGTQFSAYMGGINFCYVWSVAVAGAMVEPLGYPGTLAFFAVSSLLPLLALRGLPTSGVMAIARKGDVTSR